MKKYDDSQSQPLVSVLCQAYNHGEFIEDCLKGFIMQKTSFIFEVLIHDDASTDNTAGIIREYEKKHPELIKPIYQTENQFSQNKKVFSRIQLPRAKYKYVAICEGDDYWSDPLKLQKQVDFLENNMDFAICHHNLLVEYDDPQKESHFSNPPEQKEISTIQDLAKGNFIYTASCVFRNKLFKELPEWFAKCRIGDYPMHMLNAQYGKIKFIDEVMGVYRVHKGGVWENKDKFYKLSTWIELTENMKTGFSPEINQIILESENKNILELMCNFEINPIMQKKYSHILLDNDPDLILKKIDENNSLIKNIKNLEIENNSLIRKSKNLEIENNAINKALYDERDKLDKLKNAIAHFIPENQLREISQGNLNKISLKDGFYINGTLHSFTFFTRVLLYITKPHIFRGKLTMALANRKIKRMIRNSKFFDAEFYLSENPDVRIANEDPLIHYLKYGGFEGRNPSLFFNSQKYLHMNPDVKESGMNPLAHYLLFGIKEKREPK